MSTGVWRLGDCPDCGMDVSLEVVREVHPAGGERLGAWCHNCRRWGKLPGQRGPWLTRAEVGAAYEFLRIVGASIPDRECAVIGCGDPGIVRHEWAHPAVFGTAAAGWPASWLCVKHHEEWLARMAPLLVTTAGQGGGPICEKSQIAAQPVNPNYRMPLRQGEG